MGTNPHSNPTLKGKKLGKQTKTLVKIQTLIEKEFVNHLKWKFERS